MKKLSQIALIAAVAFVVTGTQSCAKRRNLAKPAAKAEDGASKEADVSASKRSEWMDSTLKMLDEVEAKEKAKSELVSSQETSKKSVLANEADSASAAKEAAEQMKAKNQELMTALENALKNLDANPPAEEKDKRIAVLVKLQLEAKLAQVKSEMEKTAAK